MCVFVFFSGDSASIYMFELTEKDKSHSYKSTWDSYLDSLKQYKQAETGMQVYIFQEILDQ